MDRSSSFDRQSFGSFSRGDNEKIGRGKEWQKSSTALASFQNANFGSTSKNRSLGWHGEGRRHSREYTQSPEPTSLCGTRSSTGRRTFGNRHHEKDLFGKSLAECSSATRLATDNRFTDNERSIPAAISSPREGKDVAVTTNIDQLSHPSLAVVVPIDTHQCIPYNTELEARLDSYRQSISVDLFVSKDHPSDQKFQERKFNKGISPLYSTVANRLIIDGGQKLPSFLDAPLLSPPVISPSSCDQSSHPSPRKRQRLGWGQGLAKYEKKKVLEIEKVAHPQSLKDQNRVKLEISGVPGICSSTGLTISTVCDVHTKKCSSSHISSKREDSKLEIAPVVCIEAFHDDGSKSSGERQCGHKMGSIQNAFNVRKNDLYLEFKREQTSSEDKMEESHGYPSAHGACFSKETILLNIEKVELEVDSVEKELAKLNYQIQLQDFNNMMDNACGAQGVHPKSSLFSDPQSNLVSSDENCTQVCESSLAEKHTSNSIQTSDGIDSCLSDASASVIQLEGDAALQQKMNCGNLEAQSLIYESVSAMDIPMKSIKSLPEKDCLLLSNIPSEQNFYLHDRKGLLNSRKYGALSNFCEAIINENQEQAIDAGKSFEHLLPSSLLMIGGKLYDSPEGAPNWFHNKEFHQRSKEEMKQQLERQKKVLRFKEQLLAFRSQTLSKIWKREPFGLAKKKYRSKAVRQYDTQQRNGYLLNDQRSSSRLRFLYSGIANHDTLSDELPVIKKLLLQSPSKKGSQKMPAMILDEKERLSRRFVTRNALVEDPVASDQERKTMNPWTFVEKKVFWEKFALFNKNFAKIASYLQQKTVADCIEFYYRNKKLDDFETVLRRQTQPKKRRDFTQGSHSYLATTSTANRFCGSNAAVVDTLSMVAALASSGSLARNYSRSRRHNLSKRMDASYVGSAAEPEIVAGFGAKKLPDVNEMKPGNSVFATEAETNSGCTLSLCSSSSSEKGNLNTIVDTGCLNSPSFTKCTKTRYLRRPKVTRILSIPNDTVKASREEVDAYWSDSERQFFLDALKLYGKDFSSIALHVGTKTAQQCKLFYGKTRKHLGLDKLLELHPLKSQGDHAEGMGHSEPGSEIGNKVSSSSDFGKRESSDTCIQLRINQANSAVGGGGKRLEQHADTASDVAGQELRLGGFNVDTDSEITEEIKDDFHPDVLDAYNLSRKIDANHLVERSVMSAEKVDDERLIASEFEVREANEDAAEVIEIMRQGVASDLKGTFVSKTSIQADISGGCTEKEKTLEPSHDFDGVGITTSSTSIKGTHIFPPLVLEPILTFTDCSSTRPSVLPKEKCAKSLVGREAKLRREPTYWTPEEKEKFVAIVLKHGKSWSLLQENLPAKSLIQIKTYFQNSQAKTRHRLAGSLGNSSTEAAFGKRKTGDSDKSINTGSAGQARLHSGSYLKDGGAKDPLVGMNLAAGMDLENGMSNDGDLTSIKIIQINHRRSSSGCASKSSMLADQDPVSVTQINQQMFLSGSLSTNFMPTSYSMHNAALALPATCYDSHPQLHMISQILSSNLQYPEHHVVHSQEQPQHLPQDIMIQKQMQELLAISQQQHHMIHQIQQLQRMETISLSPLLHSQSTYPEQTQAGHIQQLQQSSLISELQQLEVQSLKQNKGASSYYNHQQLQAESKYPQVHDVGRIITPYPTAIRKQSSMTKDNDSEHLLAQQKQKTIDQQVANHVRQQASQLSEAQLWQGHQRQLILQKQQQQLVQLHLQRLQLQRQHLLQPLQQQLAHHHEQQIPQQQHHHQISNNSLPNQSYLDPQVRNDREQSLAQHHQATPVQQPGIIQQGAKLKIQELVEPHLEISADPRKQQIFCGTETANTARGGDIKLFGQSLLYQPSSQPGTASIADQNLIHLRRTLQ